MARRVSGRLSPAEESKANWASSTYTAYYAQRISIAIQTQAARELLEAAQYGPNLEKRKQRTRSEVENGTARQRAGGSTKQNDTD